jgi:excisionase family DNA binding protein
MNARPSLHQAATYLSPDDERAEVLDLVAALEARGVEVPSPRPALDDGKGHRLELPDAVFAALRQITAAMSQGMGVTIAPYGAMLTTQEAADFLGISRPTLVKLVESGEIPFEMRGRHRRVLLRDLANYQDRVRREREELLTDMVRSGQDAGLYDDPIGPDDRTR